MEERISELEGKKEVRNWVVKFSALRKVEVMNESKIDK